MNLIENLKQPRTTSRGKVRFTQDLINTAINTDINSNRAVILNDFSHDFYSMGEIPSLAVPSDGILSSTIRPVSITRATFPPELINDVAERVVTLLTERGRI